MKFSIYGGLTVEFYASSQISGLLRSFERLDWKAEDPTGVDHPDNISHLHDACSRAEAIWSTWIKW